MVRPSFDIRMANAGHLDSVSKSIRHSSTLWRPRTPPVHAGNLQGLHAAEAKGGESTAAQVQVEDAAYHVQICIAQVCDILKYPLLYPLMSNCISFHIHGYPATYSEISIYLSRNILLFILQDFDQVLAGPAGSGVDHSTGFFQGKHHMFLGFETPLVQTLRSDVQ
jgi:hypothetical protein